MYTIKPPLSTDCCTRGTTNSTVEGLRTHEGDIHCIKKELLEDCLVEIIADNSLSSYRNRRLCNGNIAVIECLLLSRPFLLL